MKNIYLVILFLSVFTVSFAQTLSQSFYVDFGSTTPTTGADVNGNYWTNVISNTSGTNYDLIPSNNSTPAYKLEVVGPFSLNTSSPGAFTHPDPALLGDLAIASATGDYLHVENRNVGRIKIKNLNTTKAYKFHIFGSRTDVNARTSIYSFSGLNESCGSLQTSGSNIGVGDNLSSDEKNQNTSNIFVSDYIFPNAKGEIIFAITNLNSIAHINALKIEEYDNAKPQAPEYSLSQKMYFDFGALSGATAVPTVSPDVNGNYWNNISNNDISSNPKLITSANIQTNYNLDVTKKFSINPGGYGGLGQDPGTTGVPESALLGDLAIITATQDYFYVEGSSGNTGSFKVSNLDKEKVYRFNIYGTRYDTNDRTGLFTISGKTKSYGILQMAGAGIGVGNTLTNNEKNQNTNRILVSGFIAPDANGEISIELANRAPGNFAHINAMKIEEFSNDPVIKPTSFTISGNHITSSGQTSQLTASVLPVGAYYESIKWQVDDTSIATIDGKGLLSPKKNGKVKVTATLQCYDISLSDEIEITVSGQLGAVSFSGSASEDTNPVEMRMITNLNGLITNNFEIYTSLKSGSFSFSRDLGAGNSIQYGAGATPGTLAEGGSPIEATTTGPVRITVNLTNKTYTILAISSFSVVGNSVPGGTDVTKGSLLTYRGNGVWSARIALSKSDNASCNFIINKNSQECLKRIKGTDQLVLQSQGTQFGITMEDFRTNLLGGPFDVTADLRNQTYSFSCGEVNNFKISYMGSSVAYGAGAQGDKGWAYMYTELLKGRYDKKLGLDWSTSNISIGGNNTTNLLDRCERDLLSNCSGYVIYALSLGNEGIHERGEPAYISYHDGMLKAIQQAKDAGIVPIIANNYTRGDFTATDYNYVKKLNLLMHEWDLPSINVLGAIDDGAGRWANGYQNDNSHPNTAGHVEFFCAMVPSLFDALEAGKPFPVRNSGTSYKLGKTVTNNRIAFIPENIVHPFTLSVDIKTTTPGTIAWFENESGNGFLKINAEGKLVYESPVKGSIVSSASVNTGDWKRVTLTHYHAHGVTILYVGNTKVGELNEKLFPKKFALSDLNAPDEIEFRELFFWRAGMTAEEIQYVNNNKMMKSSLEIYAPLGGTQPLENLAQSTNTLQLEESPKFYPEGKSPLISLTPDNALGSRIVRFHSSSGGNSGEGAENLILDKNVTANKTKRWSFNAASHYAIFELSDYYDVDRFEIDDCKTRDTANPNATEYSIFVSTTGTADGDWKEVVNETKQTDIMYKVKEIAPVKARYIKFVPKGISTIRIYGFRIYGRKSSESLHPKTLISAGKPVIEQQNFTSVHQSAVALFDSNLTADNSKWNASSGDKYVVIDLKDDYSVSEFKLYDAKSASSNQNIDGYKISVSSNLSAWETVVDATGRGTENIKTDVLGTAKVARYVKLEIPAARMGSEKKINLYEFEVYGTFFVTSDDARLQSLAVSAGVLSPSFNQEMTSYTVNVPKEVDKINIQAIARNEMAVVNGDMGEKALQFGANSFAVTVKATDNITTKTYQLTVNRAEKSALTGLKSITLDGVELLQSFDPSTFIYRTESNKETVNIQATTDIENAVISGIGEFTLEDGANQLTIAATSEDGNNVVAYKLIVYNTKNLLSVSAANGKGKRTVNIDSYSGMTGVNESPFDLMLGWKINLNGSTGNKWCDTSTAPWVIFSLADIYTINHIEFRDCKTIEPASANVPQYSVFVSTTNTDEGSWVEIINESGVSALNEKIKSFTPVDARFVKFVPTKGDNAVRIYGFDIYGTFKSEIDRNGVISVGKTVVNYSAYTNDMLTPANAFDGRETYWQFGRKDAFVEIDLEDTYEVDKFVVVDAADWINGYKVSVSKTGNGSDWQEVANPTFSDKTMERKEVILPTQVEARYIRLDIPVANQFGTNRMKEFEVYKYNKGNGIDDVKVSSSELDFYPNPVKRGDNVFVNESGLFSIYSMQGVLIFKQDAFEPSFVSTNDLSQGSYIIHVTNDHITKKAKLIVK